MVGGHFHTRLLKFLRNIRFVFPSSLVWKCKATKKAGISLAVGYFR